MREISEDVLNGLAEKFATLDLSGDEQAVLDKVLERAAEGTPETSGFVASEDELVAVRGLQAAGLAGLGGDGNPMKPQILSPMALKLGSGAGLWRP